MDGDTQEDQIMADVTVKVAISRITQISLSPLRAPNLLSRTHDPVQGGRSGRVKSMRVNGVSRPGMNLHQNVGLHGKPTELRPCR